MNKIFLKRNKNITLIVLIIIIIVFLIVSGIGINSILGENGLLSKTKLANTEQEKVQDELEQKIAELQSKIIEESKLVTLNDFYKLTLEDTDLTFINASYKTENEYEKIKVLYKGYIFTVDSSLNIINIEENTNIANVNLCYEIKDISEIDGKIIYKILIKLQSDEIITKVEYKDNVLKTNTGVEELGIDFEAEKAIEYKIKVTTLNGKEVEKTFIIDKELMTDVNLSKTNMYLELGEESTLEINILPYNAFYSSIEWATSDSTIVTVDENGKVTANDINEGVAVITVTVKDVINTYTESCIVVVGNNLEDKIVYVEGTMNIDSYLGDKDFFIGITPDATIVTSNTSRFDIRHNINFYNLTIDGVSISLSSSNIDVSLTKCKLQLTGYPYNGTGIVANSFITNSNIFFDECEFLSNASKKFSSYANGTPKAYIKQNCSPNELSLFSIWTYSGRARWNLNLV